MPDQETKNQSETELSRDSEKLLVEALRLRQNMTPEERVEAHENARSLVNDLKKSGEVLRAGPQKSS